jgi:hypothetical protein
MVEGPTGLGHANDGQVEALVLDQPLQRRKDLLVGQIARGPKEYKRIGLYRRGHRPAPVAALAESLRQGCDWCSHEDSGNLPAVNLGHMPLPLRS